MRYHFWVYLDEDGNVEEIANRGAIAFYLKDEAHFSWSNAHVFLGYIITTDELKAYQYATQWLEENRK